MSRYQVLRLIGIGPMSAAFIAALNWLFDVPCGRIKFLAVEIEYEAHP